MPGKSASFWTAFALTGAGAVLFIAVGAVFIVRPDVAARVELGVESATARTDIRAVYGGLDLALGVFAGGLLLRGRGGMAAGLLGVSFGGLALGRVMGIVLDGSPAPITWILLAVESAGVLGCAIAWRLFDATRVREGDGATSRG